MDGTVLIADDDRTIRTVLTQALTRAGCRVHATGSLAQLTKWVDEGRGDLVITDVMMPDGNGIDRIPAIRKARPDLPVIVISAQNTIVTAIRATEAEAFEYLPKPFDLPDLMGKAGQALSRRPRRGGDSAAGMADPSEGGAVQKADPAMPLIGHAPAMQSLFRMVARVLNADLPVVISGEAGVGKSMIARSFHDLSDRAARGLVVLSAADPSDTALSRIEAQAIGGSIIIENPASFEPAAQARLVGMIETFEADPDPARAPRLISTMGHDPQADLAAGRLRSDLYYRLAGVTMTVPPLRARIEDIVPLARHLLARAANQGLPHRNLSDEAAALIRAHPFPGNVRELENAMRRLALTAAGSDITEAEARDALAQAPGAELSVKYSQRPPAAPERGARQAPLVPASDARLSDAVEAHLQRYFDLHGDQLPPPGLYDRILREIEKPLLELALDATGGNQLRCADLLGINRNTLRKKLTDLNIEVTRRRKLM